MVRTIIIAAGSATRWGGYLGVPKHFAPVDGEPIIERTVRLLQDYNTDVWVVANTDEYRIKGSSLFRPKHDPNNFDADKFLNSSALWSRKNRTVVLYGDVFFTQNALDIIYSDDAPKDWTLYCRPNGSKLTGCTYGECFAQSFYPEHITKHKTALKYVAGLYQAGIINRCGGWEHYRAMIGKTGEAVRKPHVLEGNYVEIDDWTEDFDYPEDYDKFINNYERREGNVK